MEGLQAWRGCKHGGVASMEGLRAWRGGRLVVGTRRSWHIDDFRKREREGVRK
jgi:hypothetical protein